jgi:hypothetical protein
MAEYLKREAANRSVQSCQVAIQVWDSIIVDRNTLADFAVPHFNALAGNQTSQGSRPVVVQVNRIFVGNGLVH